MNDDHRTCRTLDCDRPYEFLTELGPRCEHHTIEAAAAGYHTGIRVTSGWRPPVLRTDQPTRHPAGDDDPHGPDQVNCVDCSARATVLTPHGPHCSHHALQHVLQTQPAARAILEGETP